MGTTGLLMGPGGLLMGTKSDLLGPGGLLMGPW